VRIERIAAGDGEPHGEFDRDFEVEGQLVLHLRDGVISYGAIPVTRSYRKIYPRPEWSTGTPTFFIAREGTKAMGLAAVSPHWTGYTEIADLVVNKPFRRGGVGLALVQEAKSWVVSAGLRGLRAETQSNNVGACALYARAGFVLAGLDMQLYSLTKSFQQEVGLFWYWRPGEDDA
jgi:ribosomal protein S18 acetylase RimI-like enzyme